MSLGLENLDNLSDLISDSDSKNQPAAIKLDLIIEDPDQPRKNFDEKALNELSESIKSRGLKMPISLRPAKDGKYYINHGARRYRACKIAGLKEISAFIDTNYEAIDQLIENIQRDNLTSDEVANFLKKLTEQGMLQKEIAKQIGKSPAYVSQHLALLSLPKPIENLYKEGRCKDVTLINDLATIFKKDPAEVTNWIDDKTQDINRTSIRILKEYLDSLDTEGQKNESNASKVDFEGLKGIDSQPDDNKMHADSSTSFISDSYEEGSDNYDFSKIATANEKSTEKEFISDNLKKPVVEISIYGRSAKLLIYKRPTKEGFGWMVYDDEAEEFEGSLDTIKVLAIREK